ncbi:hypothetical protein GDO78_004877 [Eleutherodactylus coqui]|uniref:Uncharacterized protein n=1 Tax=Eleutherodactylus coqui TaxID=57060 RepID=A0A8J6FKY6_ELECQ|nr:hypothetical protein GDO78_004877 [Eleutherodactylus coqui]
MQTYTLYDKLIRPLLAPRYAPYCSRRSLEHTSHGEHENCISQTSPLSHLKLQTNKAEINPNLAHIVFDSTIDRRRHPPRSGILRSSEANLPRTGPTDVCMWRS